MLRAHAECYFAQACGPGFDCTGTGGFSFCLEFAVLRLSLDCGLLPLAGPCPSGHFHIKDTSRCLPCFCFGITKTCQGTSRHRSQIQLRFDRPEDFKGTAWKLGVLGGSLGDRCGVWAACNCC